jgi:hypothetical protein
MPGGLEIQYDYVFEKYRWRRLRFLELLAGKKCLFIRRQSVVDKLSDCVVLGEYLQGFNKANVLYIISPDESRDVHVEQVGRGIFHIEMSHIGDSIKPGNEWQGNHKHWNELLSGVYNAVTLKMKRWFEEKVKQAVELALLSGRDVVFWGCGEMAERLLPYFLNRGIVPKFYDKNAAVIVNEPYRRIPKDSFLNYRKDYFVVVTPGLGRETIIEELRSSGYRENMDYCAMPLGSALK